ncbi:MAG: Maf family protein, partial [Thermoguttaceae bacterium]|nr:Maf family protein [Thermoguttaceae bacterium]
MNDMPNGVSPLAKETPFLSDFRLVLASRSPRRRQLLTTAGYVFDVLPADDGVEEAEEASAARLAPKELVARLAEVKARNVVEKIAAGALPETLAPADAENWRAAPKIVVACDSVAVCRDEILGKPADRADAERMLRLLSGSEHCVHTGLAL